jgi:hypothetical protein
VPHFSVSTTMIFSYSAGVDGTVSLPKAANCGLSFASSRPELISLLSLSMISVGVALGAPMPFQPLDP